MRHGFEFDVLSVAWAVILGMRLVPDMLARRKTARLEQRAAQWPTMPGKLLRCSVSPLMGRSRLMLTYSHEERGYGTELWWHDVPSKAEADHAARVMSDRECVVHYNPEHTDETTLLWSEVKAELDRDPYVPQLVRVGRVGYRWLVGLAAMAVAGLATSLVVYYVAMTLEAECLCDVMVMLALVAVVGLVASMAPLTRMMVVAPHGFLRKLGWLMNGWQRVVMGIVLIGTVVSIAHFFPILRAMRGQDDIPDKVMAGSFWVMMVPLYLFVAIVAVEALQRLKPVEIPTAV